jgi:protocatechuate 3,4-dioxygenase beta subunit
MVRLGANSISLTVTGVLLCGFVGSSSAVAKAEPIALSGKIIDANGRSLPGAKVSVYEFIDASLSEAQQVKLSQEMTTGPDGVYSFTLSTDPDRVNVTILARKRGLAMGWSLYMMRDSGKLPDIMTGPPRQMSGVVVDADNKPVSDATVFVAAGTTGKLTDNGRTLMGPVARLVLSTKTDAQGRFSFDDLPGDARFELGVQKPGYATAATFDQSFTSRDDLHFASGRTDIRLVAAKEAILEGTIIERAGGKPIEGVPIALRGERIISYFQPAQVTSQAGGRFRFDALPADTYALRVSAGASRDRPADWIAEATGIHLTSGQTLKDVNLAADKGALLEVLVKSRADDKGIPKAAIGFRPQSGDARPASTTWTIAFADANGLARIRLAAGSYLLEPRAQGYVIPSQQAVALTGGESRRVTVALERIPKVTGVVKDSDGKPVAGASLSILPSFPGETLSDGGGRFEIAWDPGSWRERDTTFCLVARHVERNLAAAMEFSRDTENLDVTLTPGVALAGKVVDANGNGIGGAQVRPMLVVSNWGAGLVKEVVSAQADGRFQVTALPANRKYDLTVNANGYGSARRNVEVAAPADGRMDLGAIALRPARLSITGQVVDPAGRPLPRVEISGYGENQPEDLRTNTDEEGRFVFPHVGAGLVTLNLHLSREDKEFAARVTTDGGADGIRITLHEGRVAATQYIGTRTYEQTLTGADKAIAGVVVDPSGKPVAGVPVGVRCKIITNPEDGRKTWMFSSYDKLTATTDARGRFAIALDEEAEYNLLVSPDQYAALMVYDVPFNTRDLKVTLETGGTLDGQLLHILKGRKVPIPNAQVKLEQSNRNAYTTLGFDRDRTTITDTQGRFHFEHVETWVRPDLSMALKEWTPAPRAWRLVYGEASADVLFTDGDKIENFEFTVKPRIEDAPSLVGSTTPSLDDLKTGLTADRLAGKAVLVCFFDFQQRPARNAVLQLAKRVHELNAANAVMLAVEVSDAPQDTVDAWAKQNNVSIPIARPGPTAEETRLAWGVKTLPWLVLTNREHVVVAEGFAVDELDSQLKKGQP